MSDMEIWFAAYLAVLAGGESTEKARNRAHVALDDYQRQKDAMDLYNAMPEEI